MFLKFLQLEFKSFLRSPQFAVGIAMKIGMLFMYAYFAAIFFFGAFGVYYGSKEDGANPLKIFTKYFLIYWAIDLVMKYFMQQLPSNNIKPLLTQKISKNQIAGYTLVKILISFFSWAFLLFMIPFTILLLLDSDFSKTGVLGLFFTTISLLFANTFINTFINKSNALLYSIFGVIILVGALHYFKIINILEISERIFYTIYEKWVFAFIPILILGILAFVTFKFIKQNLYLDKGLEVKKVAGKTENIEFLNKYGSVGTFINNDIRLIKRSKAARSGALGAIFFLFYGVFFLNNKTLPPIFPGIFITGGFMFVFGQRVPAWDSSYYPLMMTQNVPYKDFLKAKWTLIVIATFVSMILALGYVYFLGWNYYFAIFAAGLYNLGVNSYMTLFAGAFNKKPIDLNSASKGFTSGQNNFNLKLLLMLIPQLILPVAVFALMNHFFGMTEAVISLGILGLIGFLLRDKIFDMIVKTYKSEKYSTISAFKKVG